MTASEWQTLGSVDPAALVEGRVELHYAALLAAAVGASLLEPRPDDSHPNLGWSDRSRGWVGHLVPGARPFAAALRPDDLTLRLEDQDGAALAELGLFGLTLEEGMAWLGEQTQALVGGAPVAELRPPDYALPGHALASGGRFSSEHAPERRELGRWYAGAHALLCELAGREPEASPVRCWPHHFDIATLITVARDAQGAASRTVGIGLSPGDQSYATPYWYVSPWPHPAAAALPPMDGPGHWHTSGFTAAVLLGSEAVAAGAGAAQPERIRRFIASALAASRRLLEP